ncbi:phage holin family protein [Belliella pelovolcani]|uniref:phage holin family protein n=1 Tax=Belliella pelovolcani TaxID=529505 RepID=UPI0039192B6F
MINLDDITNYFNKILESIESPKLWMLITAIGAFITQYVFSQWSFALTFFIVFICDTISGSHIALKKREFTGKKFRDMLMDKCIAYFTIIISFSAGTKMVLEGSDTNIIQYLNVPFYSLFISVEIRSNILKWYKYKKWPWLGELLQMIDSRFKKLKDKDEKADQE